ncbi:hypothetical protein [Amycolatopsis aidingensis]|uniref:hypothetical protein n=1 Tax=Amycolatopsis aidingensis TaxID=2842453 RepID=UPI001C0CB1DB|nr:hypothetical protein [Amycolatopsis aidingensis]
MNNHVRPPGRARFAGVFSGDYQTFLALFGIGLLVTAFFRLDWWREALFDGARPAPVVLLGLLAVCCAFAWQSLLRRAFLWAEPAALTWLDFAGADRVRAISGRLWLGWSTRVLALGYLGTFLATVATFPPWAWLTGACLLAGSAVPALVLAARAPGTPWRSPRRLPVAAAAGRRRLVHTWAERLIRSVAVSFLDPMLMLPSARPIGGWSLRPPTLPRLAWLGVLGRARFLGSALLLALTAGLAHAALPAVPGVVLVGLGAFAALIPFGAGIGELWRSPGKLRWLDTSAGALRLWFAVTLGGLAAVWGLVLAAVTLLLGAPLAGTAWLALPVATGSVLRTAARPPVSYDDLGGTDLPFGQVPVRLVTQVTRGADLGVLGILLLAGLPFGLAAVLITLALTAYGILR